MSKRVHDIYKTKANKIRKITAELKKNPNNVSAQKSLEFWKTNDRRKRSF